MGTLGPGTLLEWAIWRLLKSDIHHEAQRVPYCQRYQAGLQPCAIFQGVNDACEPSSASGCFTYRSSNLGPARRGIPEIAIFLSSYGFTLLFWVSTTLVTLSHTRPALTSLRPPLPTSDVSRFCAPSRVISPHKSLNQSSLHQLDFDRLYSHTRAGSLPSIPAMERQVHVVPENVLFLNNAFFRMVRGALVENTCCV